MTSIQNGPRDPSDNMVSGNKDTFYQCIHPLNEAFRRHMRYWDRGDKGYITPIDTTAGKRGRQDQYERLLKPCWIHRVYGSWLPHNI